MWETTETVLRYAQQEAAQLGNDHVGTQHLLLAILRNQEAAEIVLPEGRSLSDVRGEVRRFGWIEGSGSIGVPYMGLSPNAVRAMRQGYDQSKWLADTHLAAPHLLLGLTRGGRYEGMEGKCKAIWLLLHLRVDIEKIRTDLLKIIMQNRLTRLGIVPVPHPAPLGRYKPAQVVGNRLLISGHGPWIDGKALMGKLGVDKRQVEAGQKAARQVALSVLHTVDSTVGLHRVVRLARTFGMVNAVDDFSQHPEVIDGFAEVMEQVFGSDRGVGTRSAVGHASLPRNISVEVECEFQIEVPNLSWG